MGRSFESVRQGVKDVSARWLKASKALKKEDQVYGQMIAEMAKKHSSEAFYALDDPLEAAVFSVLVEMVKEGSEKNFAKKRNASTSRSSPEASLIIGHNINEEH
jgi:hypothetical protein